MARIAIVALHRVIDNGLKEIGRRGSLPHWTGRMALAQEMQHRILLIEVEIRKELFVAGAAAVIDTGEAFAVGVLQILVGAAELAIDITDHPGPNGPSVLVRGNNLVDHSGESPGFVEREEAPWRLVATACHARSRGGCGRKSGLQKGAAVESEAGLHPDHQNGL